MKKIVVYGAGRSSPVLIRYLLRESSRYAWHLTVADLHMANLEKLPEDNSFFTKHLVLNDAYDLIAHTDVVVSLLPPSEHLQVAKHCLMHGKYMFTASYLTEAIRALDGEFGRKKLGVLMECGLDPGLDHMSTMHILETIRSQGGEVEAYFSACGGLMANSCLSNEWKYKVSWNPRNIALAGSAGMALYQNQHQMQFVPYGRLFAFPKKVSTLYEEELECYPNRDSLAYVEVYGLQNAHSILRATLRYTGFCSLWSILALAGYTDAQFQMYSDSGTISAHDLSRSLLGRDMRHGLAKIISIQPRTTFEQAWKAFEELGLFSEDIWVDAPCTPADVLTACLQSRLSMEPGDIDRVLMMHQIEYKSVDGSRYRWHSELDVYGEDGVHTAMATTVGLPLGMAVSLFLQGKITFTGIQLPVFPELYRPVLDGLQQEGIIFEEKNFKVRE